MQGPGMRRLEPGGTRTRVDSQLSTPALPHLLGPRGGAALRFVERYSPGRGFGGRAGARAPAWCVTGRGERGAARRGAPGLALWLRSTCHLPCTCPPGPMYRALYAFRSAEPNALAFAAGETFLVLERSSAHWWLAARARSGETGYVPPAYLRRLQVSAPLPARPLRACGRTPSQPRGTDPGTPPIPGPEARTSIREGV